MHDKNLANAADDYSERLRASLPHLPFGEPSREDRTALLTGVARSHGVDVDALRKIVEG